MLVSVWTKTEGSKRIFFLGHKTEKHRKMEETKREHKNKRHTNIRSNQYMLNVGSKHESSNFIKYDMRTY